MKKAFDDLVEVMQKYDLYQKDDEVGLALNGLSDKIDEVYKRISLAFLIFGEIDKLKDLSLADGLLEDAKTTLDLDDETCNEDNWWNLYFGGKRENYFKIVSHTHKELEGKIFDILHMQKNDAGHTIGELNCRHPENSDVNLWVNIDLDGHCVDSKEELQPIAVGSVEYDFPSEVFTIANEDNTEIVCDVYEDDFNALFHLRLIICLDEKENENIIVKGNCSSYILCSDKHISLVKDKQIDLSKVPIIEKVVEEPLPNCVKINGKIFLVSDDNRLIEVYEDHTESLYELFDMTTEIETGQSYSFYVTSIDFFEVACNEDRQRVREFLEFINSPLKQD
jgi:hypothetical protein